MFLEIRPKRPDDDWMDHVWRHAAPVIFGAALLVTFIAIPLGTLAIAIFWYLRTGHWALMTTASVTGWHMATEWVGLDNIVNWNLAQWIGWPSLVVGWIILTVWMNNDW